MTELSIEISNVGGIEHFEQTLSNPIAIVTGTNASNKTSLLKAVAFGIGRSTVPIRSGATEARVELQIGDERVVRAARPKGGGLNISGEALLEDSDDVKLFERFGCLLEFNDVRQAVREGRPVEDLLKEPMDLTNLEARRNELLQRKQDLKREINQLGDIEEEIASRESQLESKRERIASLEAKHDDLRERQNETVNDDDDAAELRERRVSLVHEQNELETQISELETAIERIKSEVEETKSELESAREVAESYDIDDLEARRNEILRDLDDITDRVEVLQSVLTANREMHHSSYTGVLGKETSLVEDTVTCWACGDDASASNFDETINRLQEIVERDKERRQTHQPKLESVKSDIDEAKEARSHVSNLEAEVRGLEGRLENRRESLQTKRESLESIHDDLNAVDEELSEYESEQETEVTDLQSEIEDVRIDLHAAQSEAQRLESSVGDLQEQLEERERKKADLDELSDEIVELSERIRTLEQDLREGFNDAINELIEVLDYERIERIWLDGEFNLVIAREIDGAVHKDNVEHLSESEREMVGLMLALAGYVTYDLSGIVPVLLIDTLGAFDDERTADLVAYFADETPLLLTALLPGSASAVDEASPESSVVNPFVKEAA